MADCPSNLSSLFQAAEAGDFNSIWELIDQGVDKNAVDHQLQTALHRATSAGQDGTAVLLIQSGASVNAKDARLMTPLHVAANGGHTTIMHCLLRAHADLEAVDIAGNTPLALAVRQGHLQAAQYLVGSGADVMVKDLRGRLLVLLAQEVGHSEIAHFLAMRGGNTGEVCAVTTIQETQSSESLHAETCWDAEIASDHSDASNELQSLCSASGNSVDQESRSSKVPYTEMFSDDETASNHSAIAKLSQSSDSDFGEAGGVETNSEAGAASILSYPMQSSRSLDSDVEEATEDDANLDGTPGSALGSWNALNGLDASLLSPRLELHEGTEESEPVKPIQSSQIEFGDHLGNGCFGHVYKADFEGECVVAKKLSATMEPFKGEIAKLCACRHTHLVTLLGFCEEPLTLIMEHHSESLYKRIHVRSCWRLHEHQVLSEIASALSYLHRLQICHGDLKSENVFLDAKNGTVKVSDFGLAQHLTTNLANMWMPSCRRQQVRMLCYRAPELFSPKPRVTSKSDVFAYGMVAWEVFSRKIPYDKKTDFYIEAHVEGGCREVIEKVADLGMRSLIQRAWEQKPLDRPDMEDLLGELGGLWWQSVSKIFPKSDAICA